MSRIIECNSTRPERQEIEEIVKELQAGQAVVLPTETQYSLSVRADRGDVLEMIGRIKKREFAQKTALFVKDMTMASRFCNISETASALARKFLPGPLTMVLPSRANQSLVDEKLASEGGFGIRISSAPIIGAVMASLDFPITATSANISGSMPHRTVHDIAEELGDLVSLYVDGGACSGRTPSTVVQVGEELEVLRLGQIPEDELREYLKGDK